MIFATIGTQAPFDRFIKILDEIAPMSNELIIAQTYKGRYQPKNIKTRSHTDGFQRNNAKCLDEKGISRFVPHSSI